MDKLEESLTNNPKRLRINDEDSKKNNQNNNDNVYEFLKEENKKLIFDKLINNFSEHFLLDQKLTISRQNQIPYFKFNEKPVLVIEEQNKKNEHKKRNGDYEIINEKETDEIILGNDIIYGLTLLGHYVIAVTKEYMKMFDLKDANYKEVKSIYIKDVFFLLCKRNKNL